MNNLADKFFIGTWGLAGTWTESEKKNKTYILQTLQTILEEARKIGVSKIDTAPVYGQGIIEKCLKDVPHADFFLATKIRGKIKPDPKNVLEKEIYYTPEYIEEEAAASLKRTGRDYVDLLQLHNWTVEWNAFPEYFLEPMIKLKAKGVTKNIGICLPDFFDSGIDEVLKLNVIDYLQFPINVVNTWPLEHIMQSKYLGNTKLLIRSVYCQGLMHPNLEKYPESFVSDFRVNRYDMPTLLANTKDMLFEQGNDWNELRVTALKKALASLNTPNAYWNCGITQPHQIKQNLIDWEMLNK